MSNRFKFSSLLKKFSPIFLSKRDACVVSITAIANIDCKYMKFCGRGIYGFYMLTPSDLLLEPVQKRQLTQSQVARIALFQLHFNFFLIYVTIRAILHKEQSCELKN